MAARIWSLGVVLVCLLTGCVAVKAPAPTAESVTLPPVPVSSDESWPVADYVRMGMPDPGRRWTAADYRDCRDVLYKLDRTHRAALPRMESSKSGAVFARLIGSTNVLAERELPTKERLEFFIDVLNRFPAFREIYRFDVREPALHREGIELDHAWLRMLGAAVEWNGKPLPASPGEAQPVTFRLAELRTTYLDSFLRLPADRNSVSPGERSAVVGTHSASVLASRLPWLADGTGLTEAERLRAIRYLEEDVSSVWPHVSSRQQHELLATVDDMLRRSTPANVRQALEALRQKLTRLTK
jgi:hypothetical protein